jgi:hypothetical protein
MDPRQEQIRLRALFSDLREDDERRAPSFGRCVQAANGRGRDVAPVSARWTMLAVVSLAFVGVASVALFSRVHRGGAVANRIPGVLPEKHADTPAIQSISSWQSPTAFLLDVPTLESKPASRFDEDWMIPSRSRSRQPLF